MDRRRARAILKGMEMKYRAMIGIGSDFDEIYAQFVEALEMAGSTEDRWRAPPRLPSSGSSSPYRAGLVMASSWSISGTSTLMVPIQAPRQYQLVILLG